MCLKTVCINLSTSKVKVQVILSQQFFSHRGFRKRLDGLEVCAVGSRNPCFQGWSWTFVFHHELVGFSLMTGYYPQSVQTQTEHVLIMLIIYFFAFFYSIENHHIVYIVMIKS